MPVFNYAVFIYTHPAKVWSALTTSALMKQWMSQDLEVYVETDWQVGSAITTTVAMYNKPMVSTGKILVYEPLKKLTYSHLASISRLPDVPESHATISFDLEAIADGTQVTVTIAGSPNEVIHNHLRFYWGVALNMLKKFVEERV